MAVKNAKFEDKIKPHAESNQNNSQADRSDPFLYLLNATSNRLKKELPAVFSKNPKVLKKCEISCDKMQSLYFTWEHNIIEAREGLRSMDPCHSLEDINAELQRNIRVFNETINKGKETMGEAKRTWNNKCKMIYRSLDPKGKYKENLLENIDEAAGSLQKGCREIYSISKNNHASMKTACHKVIVEYNKALKIAPASIRKNPVYKAFPISPKTMERLIGKAPKG